MKKIIASIVVGIFAVSAASFAVAGHKHKDKGQHKHKEHTEQKK